MNGIEAPDAIEPLRTEIENEFGIKAIYCNANMMEPAGAEELINAAINAFGQVDILVNNAGIQFVSPVEDFPHDKWQAIINLNMSSAFYTCKQSVGGMKERKWGRIINIASAHGLVASPFKSAYVAAKHGMLGFTKSIALEVAEYGVTVNAICPGYVWTPLVESQIPDTMKARGMSEEEVKRDVLLKAQPTKRFVTIEEVAALAVFLCSDEASSITGSAQSIDGGWVAQ
jgi:3-hydroxybutyrate dehydrogenase